MREVYVLPEEFTVMEVSKFKEEIYSKISTGCSELVIDFSKCTFIDSTGLGAIVSVFKRLNEKNGELSLEHMQPYVKELFAMTRLDHVMKIKE